MEIVLSSCLIVCLFFLGYFFKKAKFKEKENTEVRKRNIEEEQKIVLLQEKEQLIQSNLNDRIASINDRLEQQKNISLLEYEKYSDDIKETQAEAFVEYQNIISDLMEEVQEVIASSTTSIDYYKSLQNQVIENHKKDLENKEKDKFYIINLLEESREDIQILKNIIPNLHNQEIINKLIWKSYYEKPATDMIGRVVGKTIKTGIYRISNIENGMCYVGQAVDIASRWKQHIKRGLGAEPRTRNKLYPVMGEIGVENFKFEILQECCKEDLNSLEVFWIDYYQAKDFGYVMRKN